MLNDILNNNVKALNILATQIEKLIKNHEHNYDITFLSVIKQINLDGTYSITDKTGTQRKLTCSIPNLSLNIGQYVWVKIPCGDLKNMHICGIKNK